MNSKYVYHLVSLTSFFVCYMSIHFISRKTVCASSCEQKLRNQDCCLRVNISLTFHLLSVGLWEFISEIQIFHYVHFVVDIVHWL